MVLVFSTSANGSPQVRHEVERAVSKGKFIIPFRVERCCPHGFLVFVPQTTPQSHLWGNTTTAGANFPRPGRTERMSDHRRASNAGPCAYVHRDPTKASSRIRDWFLKGKSAIAIARSCGKERNFTGEHFWVRGCAVSTVGFELEQIRKYIREQEGADGTGGQF